MTIDERLEFLLQSTESLHASTQELHAAAAEHSRQIAAMEARQEARDVRESRLRIAMLNGIKTFLEGMNGDGGDAEV